MLDECNERLWSLYQVSIGIVTCNYGADDLGSYTMQRAEDMGLGGDDMIVVLDIEGCNCWLLQGAGVAKNFTDQDCSDYVYKYMEKDFVNSDYDSAVLKLAAALENWYQGYYG